MATRFLPRLPMRTIDDLDCNELVVVARQAGEVSVWGAWKRRLASFHDPAMWEGVEAFPRYFERLEGAWGHGPYGVVVVDFDRRRVLSMSDWSTPSSFHPQEARATGVSEENNPALAPMKALARRPDEWRHVTLSTVGVRAAFDTRQSRSLADLVGEKDLARAHASPEEAERIFFATLTPRRGLFPLSSGSSHFLGGTYLPEGWVQSDDRGAEMPTWLVEALQDLHRAGFPPPSWEAFDNILGKADMPTTASAVAELSASLTTDAPDEDTLAIERAARAYQNLKLAWAPPSAARRPGP